MLQNFNVRHRQYSGRSMNFKPRSPSGAPATPALAMTPLAVGASGELTLPGLPAGHAFVVRGTATDGRVLGPKTVTLVNGTASRVVLD